jgi:hypothetical protein
MRRVEWTVTEIPKFTEIRIHSMIANIVPPDSLEQLGLVRQAENGVPVQTAGSK